MMPSVSKTEVETDLEVSGSGLPRRPSRLSVKQGLPRMRGYGLG